MYQATLAPASNRAAWNLFVSVTDDETGEGVDLSNVTILVQIRDPHTFAAALSAESDDGIEITDDDNSIFQVAFTPDQMRTLCAKTYEIACTLTADADDDDVEQLFIGRLPVLDGIVS